MMKKTLLASVMIASLFSIAKADNNANTLNFVPNSLVGHQMIMSYYQATGDLVSKLGLTYYSNLEENTFYSAHLDGTDGHDGYYSYHRLSDKEGVITVEHPSGPYKGWSYDMHLHFNSPYLGTFDIADQGMINGTMRGVFTLS